MIENEQEFRFTLERLVKMYALREQAEVEPQWSEEQRGFQVFQENALMQKLRRQSAFYLSQQPTENFGSGQVM